MVDIVSQTIDAYLVKAKVSPVEDCYLIVPNQHVTVITDLPHLWRSSFEFMLSEVPWYELGVPFNLSLNSGGAAGQTLAHIHFWIIPRNEPETAPSYGKGTATLIKELNQTAIAAT